MERTILVAEDSPTQAEYLRLLLEAEGYRVERVADGRAGLERVQLAPPDLIISDVMMPEMDGYAFCREVKRSGRTRRIPFVLLTERNAPTDVIRGLQAGADNFITKPFQEDYLLGRVDRIFQNLDLRRLGHLEVEITLRLGGQEIVVNADKQQMIELLFSTLDEVVRLNGQLVESQRLLEEHALGLERKVQERTEQLLQNEKLATMGTLLAGVAHELNNPLSVLLGHATLLRETVTEPPLAERAAMMARAADRCARIVKNFLALVRQHPPARELVSLNLVVDGAIELLAYPLRLSDIEVALDLDKTLPALWADPHQLQQVMVNLVTNAHHALQSSPPPRRLRITTRPDPARGSMHLEIADSGPGIALENQGRIFEPFFTTKTAGEGTGLGLWICRGLVTGHGGSIRLQSRPGEGAVFAVELPVQVPPRISGDSSPCEQPSSPRKQAILVVDDEPEMAAMLSEILVKDGHHVETAGTGAEALDRLHEREYDLILSDLRMPDVDGPGLYQALAKHHPELLRRLVFVTGDVLSPRTREFLEQTGAPILGKPFALAELRRVVGQALRGASA